MNDGNYEEAKTVLDKILLKDPGFSPARKSLIHTKKQLDIQKNLNEAIDRQQEFRF
jgi:hypothetical protein